MERIEHLIQTFKGDYPDADETMLREFAQHVCRVMEDDIRADLKSSKEQVSVSMQVHGMAFSAKGPRYYVEELLERWQERINQPKNITPGFNRVKLISGSGR